MGQQEISICETLPCIHNMTIPAMAVCAFLLLFALGCMHLSFDKMSAACLLAYPTNQTFSLCRQRA